MVQTKSKDVWEFGDFQTPDTLASVAVNHLVSYDSNFRPRTIIEPTCGVGSFLVAAADTFPNADRVIGVEIKPRYMDILSHRITDRSDKNRFSLIKGDFFKTDWSALLANMPKPILIIGNPPWVTSSDIGRLHGSNLPQKSNFQNYSGLEALTGKANFDISEWMLLNHMDWLNDHAGCMAMLCKSAIARKILRQAWKGRLATVDSQIVKIDAMEYFGASVDACFFILGTNREITSTDCRYFDSFEHDEPSQVFGYHEGIMLSDVPKFYTHYDLLGSDPNYTWRSGMKHDCSRVMELKIAENSLQNGYGEYVNIEDVYVYPLLKSSDLGNGRTTETRLKVIVTQEQIGDPTEPIKYEAPATWDYLDSHGDALDRRRSVIYREKPRFSVFGIGPYSFTNWKVAISGFYKRLDFQVVGPICNRPVIFDDTIYFLSAACEEEARFLIDILKSSIAQDFLSSMVFWSDKRPITVDLLKRLHIGRLAQRLGRQDEYTAFTIERTSAGLFAQIKKQVTSATK
ncbi:MAG: N-6 DNA methylase [Aestuariivita sp.]|nr:N-6 DNA methylase [Aestuariivita sp.]